jgi:hypothetical protein
MAVNIAAVNIAELVTLCEYREQRLVGYLVRANFRVYRLELGTASESGKQSRIRSCPLYVLHIPEREQGVCVQGDESSESAAGNHVSIVPRWAEKLGLAVYELQTPAVHHDK